MKAAPCHPVGVIHGRCELDPNVIGLVMISHLHGDHFGGLPFLVLDGQFRPPYHRSGGGRSERTHKPMRADR